MKCPGANLAEDAASLSGSTPQAGTGSMDNYYQLLGVRTDASPEQIRHAYRNLAKQHHPDSGGDEEKFKKIGVAYCILSDPESRRDYDRIMHISQAPPRRKPFEDFYESFYEDHDEAPPRQSSMESAWNLWHEMFGEEEAQLWNESSHRSRRPRHRADAEDLWEDGYGGYAGDDEDDLMSSFYRFHRSMRSRGRF